ncbi:centrosome and spindle pole-associated protein 1 isoform X4 [Poecilia latipinna]|uniref:centrosome and spindle pole-associated protein 1 isoform X4 n=1 Tax=Poecilia latipinna TaxID=48699 RepID=UPI00072E594C|nr:PREDICTED: centrosome and spindle pole-associated protein 1 isoform X4 [Poecilia latipinna]
MPPSASTTQEITQNLETDSGIAALGRDYEKKKQKLLLELQLEYKDYVAKKKDCKSHVPGEQQGLSLPIEEKVSVKERLREERQREYNLFLQEQAQNRRAKKGAHLITPKPEHQSSDAVSVASPGSAPSFMNSQTSTPPYQRESPVSVKNAATLTEAGDYRGSPDTWSPCCHRRRRWEVHQPKKTHSSEEELNTEEEEDYDFIPRRRRGRSTNEQECKEEWGTPEHGQRRDLQDIKEMEALAIRDQNSSDGIWKAEEKKSVLKLGAAEATTPEKEQIGAASHQDRSLEQDVSDAPGFDPKYDNLFESSQPRTLGQNPLTNFGPNCNQLPLCGMGAMQAVPPFNYCNTFPGVQGQVAIPWVPVVPPGSHVVSNGDASWYEGPRKQDPYSNQYLNGGAQQKETCGTSQRSESTERYREAPRRQVTEKEGWTKREKEKKKREAALQEGELVVYDPWGKGGGGAPIRDKHGNLVSDLYQMRSFNNKRMTSLGAELESPISLQESSHPSPLQQDRYTEELRQQIEERKRKKAEERERVRIAEEDEEKKLAMERVRIQQQYEEEKRREKEMRSKGKQSNKAETHDIEKVLGKERKHHNAPQSVRPNERRESQSIPVWHRKCSNDVTSSPSSAMGPLTPRTLFLQREPSPPIPTLQRKQTSLSPSPSSDMSSPTSRIERIVSAPSIQPVPERKPSIPAGQQEVIRELSTLRKFLRREQRQLELQLKEEAHNPYLHKH